MLRARYKKKTMMRMLKSKEYFYPKSQLMLTYLLTDKDLENGI
jgi:hypothetical protein